MKELIICIGCMGFILNISIRSALDFYLGTKSEMFKPSSWYETLATLIIKSACYYFLMENLKGAVHYLIS